MLSIELQHTIHDILARTNAGDSDGIDSADILQIGTLFSSLNDIQRHLTRQHQRRLLLQILTFRHLVPIWDRYRLGNHRLRDDLDSMVSLVLKRLSPGQAQQALDLLWDHIEAYPHEPPAIEHIGVSLYTTLKVLEMIENPTSAFSDYAPDTHAGVALWYAAHAYVAHQTTHKHEQHHYYRQYWHYWLTDIVPRAWFALPEDTM